MQDQDCTTCTTAGPKVHLATEGSRDHTILPVNVRVIVTVPARSCCGPSLVRTYSTVTARPCVFVRGFVRGAGAGRSRMQSIVRSPANHRSTTVENRNVILETLGPEDRTCEPFT